MTRNGLGLSVLMGLLLGCESNITEHCSGGATCALHPTLVVTGRVQASINPLSGVAVTVTVYRVGCSGATLLLLPSPAEAITDSQGQYQVALEPTEAAAGACVEVANSPAFKVDRPGVPIHLPPAVVETLHVDLIGP
jgi:hypothetical protein